MRATLLSVVLFGALGISQCAFGEEYDVSILKQIEALRSEMQDLKGVLEEQAHEILLLKKGAKEDTGASFSKEGAFSTEPMQAKPVLSENHQYEAAYKLLQDRRYEESLKAFDAYKRQFPEGKFLANVHYWEGEIHWAKWQLDRTQDGEMNETIKSFSTVVQRFPKHAKAADALFKLGIIAKTQGQTLEANAKFQELINLYPESSAASLAKIQIVG